MIEFVLGVLARSLFEYLLHRYVAHWNERLCAHHVTPRDYTVGPSWSTVITLLALPLPLVAWFDFWPPYLGFVVGYLIYARLHWEMHHGRMPLRYLRRLHAIHHHWDDTKNFGVTSPLWDVVFRSYKGNRT